MPADSPGDLPDPAAVTFYDDPVTLVGLSASAWGQQQAGSETAAALETSVETCVDATPPHGGPTVFAARDNPSLYHLMRCVALPCHTQYSQALASCHAAVDSGAFQLALPSQTCAHHQLLPCPPYCALGQQFELTRRSERAPKHRCSLSFPQDPAAADLPLAGQLRAAAWHLPDCVH